jgi:hypothetical protein
MNRQTQDPRPDCVVEVDVSHGGDVEIETCEGAVAAILSRQQSVTESVDVMHEFTDEFQDFDDSDTGRPPSNPAG